jgi:hypothetical protein
LRAVSPSAIHNERAARDTPPAHFFSGPPPSVNDSPANRVLPLIVATALLFDENVKIPTLIRKADRICDA